MQIGQISVQANRPIWMCPLKLGYDSKVKCIDFDFSATVD